MKLPEQMVMAPITGYLYHKAGMVKQPLSGTFELSPLCNFSCRMCYVRKTAEEVKVHPRPMVSAEQWITWAKDAYDAGMLYLLLTGGEPLLWPDFWKLYDALYEMGFLLSINTNGSMINEEVIDHWKKRPPYRVNITLYGASDETYEALCRAKNVYTRVKTAIVGLKQAGILVKLNCSLTPHNACDLEKIVNFARENQVLVTVSTYMYPPVRRDSSMVGRNDRFTPRDAAWYHMQRYRMQTSDEAYAEYLNRIMSGLAEPPGLDESCVDPVNGKLRCRAGSAAFWITWDGYMAPCGMMPEPKVDLTGISFTEGWNKITEITGSMRVSSVCEHCPNQQMCHSCAAMAIAETGTSSGIPTYLCEMVQEMKKIAKDELIKIDRSTQKD